MSSREKLIVRNRPLRIQRLGVHESFWEDVYHRMLRGPWWQFFLLFSLAFFSINFIFAIFYALLPGAVAHIGHGDWFSAFAFSVETMATIGYGYFYPITKAAHVMVTLQALASLLFTAVLTGSVFAKFSKPIARIVFSDRMILTAQNGQSVLSLRLGNVRTNQIHEGRAKLVLLRSETTSEGELLRRIVDLKLQRQETPLFALSWTLFHVIDESSPLKGLSEDQLRLTDWDFTVTFNGIDQDTGQVLSAMTTYSMDDVIAARKFKDMISIERKLRTIDFSKLHDIET